MVRLCLVFGNWMLYRIRPEKKSIVLWDTMPNMYMVEKNRLFDKLVSCLESRYHKRDGVWGVQRVRGLPAITENNTGPYTVYILEMLLEGKTAVDAVTDRQVSAYRRKTAEAFIGHLKNGVKGFKPLEGNVDDIAKNAKNRLLDKRYDVGFPVADIQSKSEVEDLSDDFEENEDCGAPFINEFDVECQLGESTNDDKAVCVGTQPNRIGVRSPEVIDDVDRPFIDVFGVKNKTWYQELEGCDSFYRPTGHRFVWPTGVNLKVTLEEDDFISLRGRRFITEAISDAYASDLMMKYASDTDVFIHSNAMYWRGTTKTFVVEKALLPSKVGPNTRILYISFHNRHAFLLEIICGTKTIKWYDSLSDYHTHSLRIRMMETIAQAIDPNIEHFVDGKSLSQTGNNCVVISLLNLFWRLTNTSENRRLNEMSGSAQNLKRLEIANELLSTSDIGRMLLNLHGTENVLNLFEARVRERKMQKPIFNMRSELSILINKRNTIMWTPAVEQEIMELNEKMPRDIRKYEAHYTGHFQFLLLNSSFQNV